MKCYPKRQYVCKGYRWMQKEKEPPNLHDHAVIIMCVRHQYLWPATGERSMCVTKENAVTESKQTRLYTVYRPLNLAPFRW